jgi:hypothetical protein
MIQIKLRQKCSRGEANSITVAVALVNPGKVPKFDLHQTDRSPMV